MNFSPESSASQMIRLPSTSSPTTLSSRISTSSGLRVRPDELDLNPLSARYPADTPGRSESFHHPVDALGERADVVGLHGGENPDAPLVAAEFAVCPGVGRAPRTLPPRHPRPTPPP